MFLMDADLNTAIAFNDDPLDTTLGTQSSSTAQDMRETVPAILWRAPAAGDYYVMTRHATFARNVGGRYGTYQIRVRNLAAPTPTVNSVAVQRMLPGESYQALVLGADFSVGATVSTSHVDLAATEVNWVGREALVVRFDAGAGLADGGYDLTVANPGGGSDSLVGALDVSAAAQPPIFITELALGNPDRVEVRNFGTQTATLTGWSIQSFSPGASPQVFTFPAFTLGAGGTVVISESGGTNTATELFDTGPPFNWPWDNGVEGDVSLLDDGGRNVDYIRFASDPIALQRAPIGTGAGWMQPDVSVPLAPLMIARDEDAALYRTAYGLSGAASTMPNGAAGRTNAVDPYEDNDSPRRAPLFGRNASIPDLAISPRGSAPADRDWFGIVVPPGDEVNVEAVFSHAGGDIDVELYAPTDETTPILVAESTTDDETIALTSAMTTANGGGVYKLHVYGFGGATNSYALELSQALRPGVTVEQAAGQADPTGSLPILFDVTFDEDVTGFDDPASDVVMGGAASGVTFGINPISASVYQIVVTAVVTDGTIVPSVPAGAAQNAAMLDNRASTSVDNSVTYDATPPTVVSVGVVAPGVVDVAFDDLMGTSALSTASYSISGAGRGSLGLNPDGVTTVAATTYRLTWLAGEMLTGGDVTIDVAGVQNRLGLAMGSPSSGADLGGGLGVAPTVLSANVQTGSSVDVTFSEPMGPTAEDRALYVISGTGRGALAASPDSAVLITSSVARLTWLGGEMFDGGNLTVALGAVRDLVGNVLGSPNTATHVGGAIGVRPTVASVAVVAARQVDVTFDEPMGAGALTPSNYTVSGLGAGSLSAAPDSVVSIGGSTYRLSWSAGTMAQGGDVTIAVASGAADPAGNPIGSPNQGTALGGGIATPSAARHWIVYR
jgi:hypothetical protein